jgi:hypothetical protein
MADPLQLFRLPAGARHGLDPRALHNMDDGSWLVSCKVARKREAVWIYQFPRQQLQAETEGFPVSAPIAMAGYWWATTYRGDALRMFTKSMEYSDEDQKWPEPENTWEAS